MGMMLSNLIIYSHIYKINLCWKSKEEKDSAEQKDDNLEITNLIEKKIKIRKRKINKKKQNNSNFNKNS